MFVIMGCDLSCLSFIKDLYVHLPFIHFLHFLVHTQTLYAKAIGMFYSVRKLFTGFAIAAFIAWKLIVANAITIAASPPAANNHKLMLMRYA